MPIFDAEAVDIGNFNANDEKPVGHLVSMKIGGEEVSKDFKDMLDPMNPAEKIPICGMITHLEWDGKPGGKIMLKGRIPYTNKGIILKAINSTNLSAECEIEFNCYEAEGEKTYFKSWFTQDAQIKCKLIKPSCYVENRPCIDYTFIKNFEFYLLLEAGDKGAQTMDVNYGSKRIDVLAFGGAAGG